MGKITNDLLAEYQKSYKNRVDSDVIKRSVTKNGVIAASTDLSVLSELNRTFSIEIETGKVSNQKRSGRCWLFAALSTLRHEFAATNRVKNFELSQCYLTFYDRIEKANFFYEKIIETADRNADDREVTWLFQNPTGDGGQWDMAAGLVEKYGVVPSFAMPETFNSEDTAGINDALNLKLRKDGIQLRQLVKDNLPSTRLQTVKKELLQDIYKMAVLAFGEPPKAFELAYKDDDKKYHNEGTITPLDFYHHYFKTDFEDYVVVINSPEKKFNTRFSFPLEGNIIDGKQINFVNVDLPVFEDLAVQQLKAGNTIWFGNDVLKDMDRDQGLLDGAYFKRAALFDVDLTLSKAQRLAYSEAVVSHAMVITGVELVDDTPVRFKVENSWGEKIGEQGYFVMSKQWFEDFAYQIVVPKAILPTEAQVALKKEPTVLPPWDSMA